jgi:hypothetical protein
VDHALTALAVTGLAAPANAPSGPILTLRRTHCYTRATGLGTAQVPAPGLRPMPSITGTPTSW